MKKINEGMTFSKAKEVWKIRVKSNDETERKFKQNEAKQNNYLDLMLTMICLLLQKTVLNHARHRTYKID